MNTPTKKLEALAKRGLMDVLCCPICKKEFFFKWKFLKHWNLHMRKKLQIRIASAAEISRARGKNE